jgi:hypothetical protein
MTQPIHPEPEPSPKPVVAPPSEPESLPPPTGPHTAHEPLPDSQTQAIPLPAEPYAAVEPVAVAQVASAPEREVVFVPMSVNIGDGFKFGCGFFLALVVAMLVGFVLLAALFVLTSLFGLNLPITR